MRKKRSSGDVDLLMAWIVAEMFGDDTPREKDGTASDTADAQRRSPARASAAGARERARQDAPRERSEPKRPPKRPKPS
ncbi:MAG TPA: hypothetical protein VIS07_19095 [Candidatus Binatia bacterium]